MAIDVAVTFGLPMSSAPYPCVVMLVRSTTSKSTNWIEEFIGKLLYTNEAIDKASLNGHINILNWFKKFDLEFKLSIEKNFKFSKINNDYIFGSKYNFKSIRGPKIKIEEKYQNDKELIAKNVKAIFDRMCLVKLNWVDLQMEKEKI
jgi:hypothetical protein